MDLCGKEFASHIEEATIKPFEIKTDWKARGTVDSVFKKHGHLYGTKQSRL